jgi:hypothetical protein
MSKLNFSARALPRDEIAAEDPAPVPPAATPDASPAPLPEGALSWLTGLFSRR